MSSWGLEMRNGQGFTTLDPDTFSVRLVETVWLSIGFVAEFAVVDIPTTTNVLAGMFAAVTCHERSFYLEGYPNLQSIYPSYPGGMPIVEIYNGFVRVRCPPIQDAVCIGNLTISIMSYI